MPSSSFRTICKQLVKVHEAICDILPESQLSTIFMDVHSKFKNRLRRQIIRSNVCNDGGPQHGYVSRYHSILFSDFHFPQRFSFLPPPPPHQLCNKAGHSGINFLLGKPEIIEANFRSQFGGYLENQVTTASQCTKGSHSKVTSMEILPKFHPAVLQASSALQTIGRMVHLLC